MSPRDVYFCNVSGTLIPRYRAHRAEGETASDLRSYGNGMVIFLPLYAFQTTLT